MELIQLPTDVKKMIWGFVGYDVLETPVGKEMKDILRRIMKINTFENQWVFDNQFVSLIFYKYYPKQYANSVSKYPKLNIQELTHDANCEDCMRVISYKDFKAYGYNCMTCYGLKHHMIDLNDLTNDTCWACNSYLTINESYFRGFELNFKCEYCFENEIGEEEDETEEEDEEENEED
jgi:hypothetical protein